MSESLSEPTSDERVMSMKTQPARHYSFPLNLSLYDYQRSLGVTLYHYDLGNEQRRSEFASDQIGTAHQGAVEQLRKLAALFRDAHNGKANCGDELSLEKVAKAIRVADEMWREDPQGPWADYVAAEVLALIGQTIEEAADDAEGDPP